MMRRREFLALLAGVAAAAALPLRKGKALFPSSARTSLRRRTLLRFTYRGDDGKVTVMVVHGDSVSVISDGDSTKIYEQFWPAPQIVTAEARKSLPPWAQTIAS